MNIGDFTPTAKAYSLLIILMILAISLLATSCGTYCPGGACPNSVSYKLRFKGKQHTKPVAYQRAYKQAYRPR